MARMIDADKLLDSICGCFNIMEAQGIDMTVARTITKGVIDAAPAVDAEPVRHGRWIDHKDEHKCSECGEYVYMDAYLWANLRYDYCPHCRADMMDGDSDA